MKDLPIHIRACMWAAFLILIAMYTHKCSAFEGIKPTAVSISLATYHFDRSTKHNEVNPGAFLEFNNAFIVGIYRNSQYRTTALVAYSVRLGSLGPLKIGAMAGVCSGYDFSVPICGMITVGIGPITIGIIPPVTKSAGVAGLSLSFPIGNGDM